MLRFQLWPLLNALCLVAVLTSVGYNAQAANDPAQFWFSTSSVSTSGPEAPSLQLGLDQTANVYLWAQPGTDAEGVFKNLRNISLDIVSTAATFDIVDNFTLNNPQGTRFEIIRDAASSPFSVESQLDLAEAQAGDGDGVEGLLPVSCGPPNSADWALAQVTTNAVPVKTVRQLGYLRPSNW